MKRLLISTLLATICGTASMAAVQATSVSSGRSNDLDKYRALYNYSITAGKTASDIVGMGIAGSNDHVYVWYKDGTVSSGRSNDLDRYRQRYRYSLPTGKTPSDIVGMGIAGSNDQVYDWFKKP